MTLIPIGNALGGMYGCVSTLDDILASEYLVI